MKWVRFSREFNFQPGKLAAVTIQHAEGEIDDVTNEHAEKAIAKGAAVEIVAPKNAEDAAKLRSGELQWQAAPVPPAKPVEKPAAPPAS